MSQSTQKWTAITERSRMLMKRCQIKAIDSVFAMGHILLLWESIKNTKIEKKKGKVMNGVDCVFLTDDRTKQFLKGSIFIDMTI